MKREIERRKLFVPRKIIGIVWKIGKFNIRSRDGKLCMMISLSFDTLLLIRPYIEDFTFNTTMQYNQSADKIICKALIIEHIHYKNHINTSFLLLFLIFTLSR